MELEKYKKIAILFIITAIALGALATHYLKEILSNNQINSVETGIRYQLFHGLALLFLTFNIEKFNSPLKKSLNLMTTGICLFSFSIYLLNMQNILGISMSFLGPITPIGGILLIIAWAILFFSIKKAS
tara:strand:- start:102 stop:488 length:387 start_codon:yes stop_codon:yes gene_type:complete